MANVRVYELARDLNITNKALMNKLKVLNIKVKSHMSSLEDESIPIIKESVLGKKAVKTISEKRVKPSVIRRRKRPTRREPETAEVDIQEESSIASESVPVQEEPVLAADGSVETLEKESVEQVKDPVKGDDKKKKKPAVPKKKKPIKKVPSAKIISKPEEDEPEEEPPVAISEASESKEVVSEVSAEAVEKETEVKLEEPEAKTPDKVAKPKSVKEKEDQATAQIEKPAGKLKKPPKKKKKPVAKIIKISTPEIRSSIAKPEEKRFSGKSKPYAKQGRKPNSEKTGAPASRRPVQDRKSVPNRRPSRGPAGDNPRMLVADDVSGKELKGKDKKKGKKFIAPDKEKFVPKKKSPFKRKSIVEGRDLYSHSKKRKGKKGGKRSAPAQKTLITTPKAIKRRLKIEESIVLSELAKRMSIKANEMIAKLMGMGVMATVNQTIDFDTAELVATEFGFEVEKMATAEDIISVIQEDDSDEALKNRPPVVTIMGHVDHGKTSLLDVIRKSKITNSEAGGITQHIGAYNVATESGQITFLDTPGHAAFTAMRARGAKVTDIVILVVAADDGVMPQTIEAIDHSKAAGVPMIVAVNKMDKEEADPDRVKRELSEHGILAEDWGGDAIFVNVSAKKETGINGLLEMILLQSEVLELKANPDRLATGHVVEAKLDSGRGPVATILVQNGTLKSGQPVVCGIHHGKIRRMVDDLGATIKEAGPSIPVEIVGLSGVPEAGDELVTLEDDKNAKQISTLRMQKQRSRELAKSSRLSLEGLFEQLKEGSVKDLNIILKADVHGSIEALKDSLLKLSTDEVKVKIARAATGTVTESDISLAALSNAIIIGFNVRPPGSIYETAKEENVDMRFYDVIYNAIQDVKDAMLGLMDSTYVEKVLGRAEVRETFVIPKKGTIAGCFVNDGKIERGQKIRLLRDGVIVTDGKIGSLRRFKDDVKEVMSGYECGIGIEKFNDIKLSDIIECYVMEEVKPTME